MTDRHSGYVVVLDRDIREDDAEEIIRALRMIRFVADVQPVTADTAELIISTRRDLAWRKALGDLIRTMETR